MTLEPLPVPRLKKKGLLYFPTCATFTRGSNRSCLRRSTVVCAHMTGRISVGEPCTHSFPRRALPNHILANNYIIHGHGHGHGHGIFSGACDFEQACNWEFSSSQRLLHANSHHKRERTGKHKLVARSKAKNRLFVFFYLPHISHKYATQYAYLCEKIQILKSKDFKKHLQHNT